MTGHASIILQLPDEKIIFQRRDDKAPISPNTLAFFGGGIESGEKPRDAAIRELAEETSLELEGLEFHYITMYTYNDLAADIGKKFYLFRTNIPHADFKVYEGKGAEVYSLQEALEREDIAPAAKHVLHNILRR